LGLKKKEFYIIIYHLTYLIHLT